jgi:hypothetical protein
MSKVVKRGGGGEVHQNETSAELRKQTAGAEKLPLILSLTSHTHLKIFYRVALRRG